MSKGYFGEEVRLLTNSEEKAKGGESIEKLPDRAHGKPGG
jgi:hypothetical protein